jgi:hypothetical protein
MAKQRPGVILYFSTRPSVSRLSKDQKADLLDAIYAYGEDGEVPNFGNDLNLLIVWDFIKQQIDADGVTYTSKVESGNYAAYCKKAKQAGVDAVPYEVWVTFTPEGRAALLPR